MTTISRSVTVRRPRHEVYQFWRRLEHLPTFMIHLESVTEVGERRSHWVAKAPAGQTIEWDAVLLEDHPDESLVWRATERSDVQQSGSVRFVDAPGDRGTEVKVDLSYEAPAGEAGKLIARLYGEEPKQQIRDDLRRFKQVMEAGEVVRSDGSPEGAGQGASKQRAAQAAPEPEGVS